MPSDNESLDSGSTIVDSNLLKELKKKRGIEKGKLTLFKKYLSKLDVSSLTMEQCLDLELRIEKLSTVFERFKKIQDNIESLCTNLDNESSNLFYELKPTCKRRLARPDPTLVERS
ncbi:hypothetical protein ACJJTC_009943 [Scirpophaga incertulas]